MSPHSLTLVDVPRPFFDTIATTAHALSVFSLTVQRPFRPQHLVLLVDAARHGVGLHSSDGFVGFRDDPTAAGRAIGHHVVSVASANLGSLPSASYVGTENEIARGHAGPPHAMRRA